VRKSAWTCPNSATKRSARSAEHEHIPEVIAAELGQELLKATGGIAEIQRILEENLEVAVRAGEEDKINDRKRVLGRFIASYCK